MPRKKLTRYPAVELLRFFDRDATSDEIGMMFGITGHAVRSWNHRNTTLGAYEADRYATMLGVHPWMVWGDLWFQIEREEVL